MLAGQAALRVSAAEWVFTDTYRDGEAEPLGRVTVSVAVDPQSRGLVVTTTGPVRPLSLSEDTRCLEREIAFGPR